MYLLSFSSHLRGVSRKHIHEFHDRKRDADGEVYIIGSSNFYHFIVYMFQSKRFLLERTEEKRKKIY